MNTQTRSIRPFIGSKDYVLCRAFYRELGFEETEISQDMSLFAKGKIAFYLQDAYVKDWIDNLMMFVEVEDTVQYYQHLQSLDLPAKFEGARLTPIREEAWGRECFLHDPSGVLWHFGEFFKKAK